MAGGGSPAGNREPGARPAAPMDYGMEAPIRAGGVFGTITQTAIPAAE